MRNEIKDFEVNDDGFRVAFSRDIRTCYYNSSIKGYFWERRNYLKNGAWLFAGKCFIKARSTRGDVLEEFGLSRALAKTAKVY